LEEIESMEARRFLILISFALICELLIISPVMGDTISMTADKDTIYFGDTITFSGSNFASDMVYLFITGTNLPACGGLLTYPRYNIINYISSTFTQANISENNTWEYKWHTANLSIDPGTYTIYAVATPNDKNNLLFTQYATQSIVILADNRVYPDMPDNTAGEEIPPDEQPSIAIPGEGIDIVSDLDNGVAYIGDAITLSGSNLNSDTVFLFVTGPNLPANGGRITDPMTAVIDNNPVSFNNYEVLDDHTWEYNWQTANINLDPGTYTIYAVSTPNSKNNLTNTQYATLPVSIRKPFLTASLSQDTVAAGENVFVQGIATGNPSPGVAIWIVGTNYCLYSTVSVNSDGTFEKEITEGTTENMANGKYSIIVQHPMHNWRFDIYPRADAGYPYRYVVGPYPIAGAENVFFTITGPGSLTSLSTINALLNDLNNPNIDDCYTRLELIVGEPSSPPLSGDYLSATVQPSVASQGGAMSIQGSAQGNPAEGIAIWIMGNDNIIYDIVQVNPDSSFEYEVPIFTLPDGEYSVVVQHPMYNKKFDIYPRADAGYPYRYVVGPYPIAGAENVFFTLDGPGSLSSSSAVEALIHDLDNPNTDDIYTELTFTIGSASSPPAEEEYLSVNILPSDIAQGQNIAITGSAKGTPNEGVAIWIIGKNFIFHDIANVEPDTTFGYDLSSDITQDLANGEYTVFVQHPMYNNKFDIYPRADAGYPYRYVVGPYPIPHAENAVFMLDGPGSLLSSSAVKALLFDLENPNIDDEYKRATFVVGDSAPYPSITSLNPSSITAGSDAFTLEVTGTNFVDGATVLWDGQERETQFVSETQLNATILQEDVSTNGTFKVKVINPNGKESGEVDFEASSSIHPTEPIVKTFNVTPLSNPFGEKFTIYGSVEAGEGATLQRVELWGNGEDPSNQEDWEEIDNDTSIQGELEGTYSFEHAPKTIGDYWYGIHVVDSNTWAHEGGGQDWADGAPIKVTVTDSLDYDQPIFKAPWEGTLYITQGNGHLMQEYDNEGNLTGNLVWNPGLTSHCTGNDCTQCYGCVVNTWDNVYSLDIATASPSKKFEVLAAAKGKVIFTQFNKNGDQKSNRIIVIEHIGPRGELFYTVYLHLNDIFVHFNEEVEQGQVIGISGNTGLSGVSGDQRTHLHFHLFGNTYTDGDSYDLHTQPMEFLILKRITLNGFENAALDSNFRRYNANNGDLNDLEIRQSQFESNNVRINPKPLDSIIVGPKLNTPGQNDQYQVIDTVTPYLSWKKEEKFSEYYVYIRAEYPTGNKVWKYGPLTDDHFSLTDKNIHLHYNTLHAWNVAGIIKSDRKYGNAEDIIENYAFSTELKFKTPCQDVSHNPDDLIYTIACPVNAELIDPEGYIINKSFSNIANAIYEEIIDPNTNDKKIRIIVHDPKDGFYSLFVTPDTTALPTDTYSIQVISQKYPQDNPLILIENRSISEIPSEPYIFSTSAQNSNLVCIPYVGYAPLSVEMADLSISSGTSRLWSFGDGTTAENETEVTHTYLQPGNYTVTLTVSGPDGEDSVSQAIQVTDDTIAKEFLVQLNGGWNIFSTPVKLEPGKSTFGEIFTPTEQQKIQVVLGWDEGYWFIPGPSTHVDPLYAYFIKIEDDTTATAVLVPSETATALPSRQMTEGINLIGPAPAYDENSQVFQTMPIDQGLVSIEHVGDLTGYVIVVSPHLNQPGWAYAKGGQVKDLLPFKGYWITMENGPDTMYGFSTTPM